MSMKAPVYSKNQIGGKHYNHKPTIRHEHSFTELLGANREGLRIQCWCGRHVIYTPYMEIELPSLIRP